MELVSEEAKYATLLNQLKVTVENSLGCHASESWNMYGGLQRLHVVMAEILGHGFRFLTENGKPDLWVFIQGLSWLQPTLAASPSFLNHPKSLLRSPVPVRNADKALTWLNSSIDNRSLSEKLSWLLSDQEHLISCYSSVAFIRQQLYSEATLICLRAVEQRQLSLLATIDTTLWSNRRITTKKHRRCSSYSEPKTLNAKTWSVKSAKPESSAAQDLQELQPMPMNLGDATMKARITRFNDRVINSIFKSTKNEKKTKEYIKQHLLKRWCSADDIILLKSNNKRLVFRRSKRAVIRLCDFWERSIEKKCSSTSNLPTVQYKSMEGELTNEEKLPSMSSCLYQTAVPSNIGTGESKTSTDVHSSRGDEETKKRRNFFKLPFHIWEGEESDDNSVNDSRTLVQANVRKSFIENGGSITLPMSIGAFPRPFPGQSIISFLRSGIFSPTNAELDRENAHFNISEAMIVALEQVKFNELLRQEDEIIEESDEEMNHLNRILRTRRRQKQKERCSNVNLAAHDDNIDSANTMTTDQSVNSLSLSVHWIPESISADQDKDELMLDKKNLTSKKNFGSSVSKRSIFSDTMHDFGCKSDLSVSAESVAISLLCKFEEKQLPAASEIEWLVSEREAPQQILPLPNSVQVNEPSELNDELTLLRGTSEWAPPRPQIIFTPHPPPSRTLLLEKQQYKCAGCGTTVAQKYASKLLYCDYLGRYFCSGCHSKQTTIIPGRVLSKWDFNKYPVSNFSYKLLDRLATDPLFNVMDLNSSLYGHVRQLQKIRLLRVSLFYLKDFIFSCKYSIRLQEMIKVEAKHVFEDPDCYSMADFIRAKNGSWLKALATTVKSCETHVNQCQLCQARGFMCEICVKPETIYPWELDKVVRCNECGSCHHMKCYQHVTMCPKCTRIRKRNKLAEIGPVDVSIS